MPTVAGKTHIGRRIVSENGMNGRLLQVRRRRLGIKASDLAALAWMSLDSLNRIENCRPYIDTRNTIVMLDDLLARFETKDIATLIKDYLHAEAHNSPYSDYDAMYPEETTARMLAQITAHKRILDIMKRIKEPLMGQQLYTVTYANGETQEEYGSDEADVREFIARSFAVKGAVKSVTLYVPEQDA